MALICAGTFAGTAALGQDGTPRPGWESGLHTGLLLEASPVIGPDGTIYVAGNSGTSASRGEMLAIRPDATLKWRFADVDDEIEGSAALSADGRTLYFGAWDGRLYALDTATGRKKWHFDIDVDAAITVRGTPAIGSDGTIYFGSSDAVDFTRPGSLHALVDEETRPRPLWQFRVPGGVEDTPAIGPDGTIYFGAVDAQGGRVFAVLPDGRSEKWPSVRTAGAIFSSSPVLASDGTLYIGTYAPGGVYAISPQGEIKWVFHGRSTEAAISVEATPTLGADGTIYVGTISDLRFYALTPDGREKWSQQFPQGSQIFTSTAVRGDGSVVFAVNAIPRSTVYGFDAAGNKLFERERNGLIYSSPAIAPDGTIYFGAFDRRLHSLQGSGSPVSVISNWPMFGRDLAHTSRVPPPTDTRLINLSTRAAAGAGKPLIAGFAIGGAASKPHLVRAVGPTLTFFPNVPDPLNDPAVTLYAQETPPRVIVSNDDWLEPAPPGASVIQAMLRSGAFALPEGSQDAVVLSTLAPGLYSAVVDAVDGGVGTALVEVYDTAPADSNASLINLSTFGQVGPDPLIAGLVIRGTQPLRVLVRAVGPGLARFGITDSLARPTLTVFTREGAQIATNTGWSTNPLRGDIAAAGQLTGAFALAANSADSATVLSLTPGSDSLASLTFQVTGSNGATGQVLVEIYVIP